MAPDPTPLEPEEPPLDTFPLAPELVPGASRAGRNLPIAIASGVLLAGTFLGTLLLNDWAFLTFVAALVVVALLELRDAFRSRGARPAVPVAIVGGLVTFFGAYVYGAPAQVLGLVLVTLGAFLWALADPQHEGAAAGVGATILMALWVPFCTSFMGVLLARPDGARYVMAVVALIVTNDIGAYAWGSQLGRHKLAPSISPGKTWEGFVGGLATVLLLAGTVTTRFVPDLGVPQALTLGAGIALTATLGDLVESLIKRDLGVKDLGSILPGHGGIMDRVDAIILTLPVAHLLLLALGR